MAAVPAEGKGWAYLSSGTWSLLGVESAKPWMTPACAEAELTNEVGFGHSIRLLKNIAGLWLVQECRRDFAKQGREMDYDKITKLASEAKPLVTLLDPFLSSWNAPGEMGRRIADYAKRTGQSIPGTEGAFVRCCLESLALAYRESLESIEKVTGEKIKTLHIVGGGESEQAFESDGCGCNGTGGGGRTDRGNRHRQSFDSGLWVGSAQEPSGNSASRTSIFSD